MCRVYCFSGPDKRALAIFQLFRVGGLAGYFGGPIPADLISHRFDWVRV